MQLCQDITGTIIVIDIIFWLRLALKRYHSMFERTKKSSLTLSTPHNNCDGGLEIKEDFFEF